ALDGRFMDEAPEAGRISLKRHRELGGLRASIYDTMPVQGEQALADLMRDFQQRNGEDAACQRKRRPRSPRTKLRAKQARAYPRRSPRPLTWRPCAPRSTASTARSRG